MRAAITMLVSFEIFGAMFNSMFNWDKWRYFSGDELWGDDFAAGQIAEWFDHEREGYANLGAARESSADSYGYHALNVAHGFQHLPDHRFSRVIGMGSGYGGEFLPIIDRIDRLTIIEPSASLRSHRLRGVPISTSP